jgi:hypothetical protein
VQPTKCVAWFPKGLDCYISLPFGVFTPNWSFHILSTLVGSFVESFVATIFHEDLGTISNLPMFTHIHMAFVMFLLFYVQCPNYLFHIMFPSPSIL